MANHPAKGALRALTAKDLRRLRRLGRDAALMLSAMPRKQALVVRAELVRVIDALRLTPRQTGLQQNDPLTPEIQRIAEQVARILRVTLAHEQGAIWSCLTAAMRERQTQIEDAAADECLKY